MIERIEYPVHLVSGGRRERAASEGRPRLVWVEATEARSELEGLWAFLDDYLDDLADGEFDTKIYAFPTATGGVRHPAGRLLSEALGLAVAAEKECEADLIIFNDWAMPVAQARALLDVPVTGISEASIILGNTLARRPAIITVAEGMRPGIERDIAELGLSQRMASPSVWWLDPPSTHEDVLEAVTDGAKLVGRFDAVAQEAVAAGADAVLVGCGYYGPVFVKHGYTHVSGHPEVPVYDCARLGMEMGRILYRLQQHGVGPSRRAYPVLDHDRLGQARALMSQFLTTPASGLPQRSAAEQAAG